MKKIIHHMRRQPESTRRHILHIVTIGAGIILFILWIYSLGTSLSSPDTQAEVSKDLQPFSALKDNLVGGYNGVIIKETVDSESLAPTE